MSRLAPRNQVFRIQGELIHKADTFLHKLDRDVKGCMPFDFVDVYFDYESQKIHVSDSGGNIIDSKDF